MSYASYEKEHSDQAEYERVKAQERKRQQARPVSLNEQGFPLVMEHYDFFNLEDDAEYQTAHDAWKKARLSRFHVATTPR